MRVFDCRKLLTVSVLLLVSTLVVNGATSKETAVVKDLSFHPIGESLEVKIATSEPTRFTYFELSSPRRLVVDFHGIQNAIGFKEKPVETAGVERVRTSMFTNNNRKATRIVFDIAENVPYTVSNDGAGNVKVFFGVAPATQPARPEIKPVVAIEPIALIAGPPIVPQVELKPLLGMPPAALVPTTRVAMSITAPQAPAPAPAATPTPQLPTTVPPPAQTLPQYSGELISIDCKDCDLKDFFRFLADTTGLNIVLDPGVSGTVTLTLTDVPWDQALDIVLKNHQLGSELTGNVLRIATNAALQNEENGRRALADARELAVPLETHNYKLNYIKTDVVAATLARLLTQRGTIIPDQRQNAVIVSDIPRSFTKIDQLIKFLDQPTPQVEIEARLLSANKSFSRELGSQLGFVFGNNSANSISGAPLVGASPFTRIPVPGVNVGGAIPLSVNLPAAGTSGLSFLLGTGADIILDEIITAAEARGTAKLISRPKVMTLNNVAATVQQGTQIPVQSNQNNTISVQFLNFSLKLTVTPQITDVGTILMQLNIENSTPDFARAVNGIPSVATQQTQTQVMIPDGFTGVIGGILIDTDSYNVRQVPGLGSIPLIGHLFKNTATIKSTAELLFFITPRIKPADTLIAPTTPPGQQR